MGFSEIAVALAGFAAIALVLGQREGVLPPGSAYVVQYMVLNTLGPAIMALFAAVILELGARGPGVWRLCSGIFLAGAAAGVVSSLFQERAIERAGGRVLPRWFTRVAWTISAVAHTIQLANLVGFPVAPSMGVFLLGLWVMVAVGAMQFVALLFASLR